MVGVLEASEVQQSPCCKSMRPEGERITLAGPWLPCCSIYRSGGGREEGIKLSWVGCGLQPAHRPAHLSLPSFWQNTLRFRACRSGHKPQVPAPLGLCPGSPVPSHFLAEPYISRLWLGATPAHGPARQFFLVLRQATNGRQS